MPDVTGVNSFTTIMTKPTAVVSVTSTTTTGNYIFPNNFVGAGTYRISLTKNTNYLSGCSSLDLAQISKFILGTVTFDNWQIMAADINGNNQVADNDLRILRDAILGLRTNFGIRTIPGPGTQLRPSWLTWYDNSLSPAYTLQELQANEIAQNSPSNGFPINATTSAQLSGLQWLCRKLGDVNNSANVQAAKVVKNTKDFIAESAMERETSIFKNTASLGDEITLRVTISEEQECIAWQSGLSINSDALEIIDIKGVKKGYYNNNVKEGYFNAMDYVESEKKISTPLCYELRFRVKQNINDISTVLTPQNETMETVAYNSTETEISKPFIYTLEVKRNNLDAVKIYPNPVSDVLNIALSNVNSTELSIIDALGRSYLQKNILNQKYFSEDVSFLEAGAYTICITNNDGTKTFQQLIKK